MQRSGVGAAQPGGSRPAVGGSQPGAREVSGSARRLRCANCLAANARGVKYYIDNSNVSQPRAKNDLPLPVSLLSGDTESSQVDSWHHKFLSGGGWEAGHPGEPTNPSCGPGLGTQLCKKPYSYATGSGTPHTRVGIMNSRVLIPRKITRVSFRPSPEVPSPERSSSDSIRLTCGWPAVPFHFFAKTPRASLTHFFLIQTLTS